MVWRFLVCSSLRAILCGLVFDGFARMKGSADGLG
jgi:hypothetical protein